jgi:hypothetical protein
VHTTTSAENNAAAAEPTGKNRSLSFRAHPATVVDVARTSASLMTDSESIYDAAYAGGGSELPLSDPLAARRSSQEKADALRKTVTRRTIGVISVFALAGIYGIVAAPAPPAASPAAAADLTSSSVFFQSEYDAAAATAAATAVATAAAADSSSAPTEDPTATSAADAVTPSVTMKVGILGDDREDPVQVLCLDEIETCGADETCVALTTEPADMAGCYANAPCAAAMRCMMRNAPVTRECAQETNACLADPGCTKFALERKKLFIETMPANRAACNANSVCAPMMQCICQMDENAEKDICLPAADVIKPAAPTATTSAAAAADATVTPSVTMKVPLASPAASAMAVQNTMKNAVTGNDHYTISYGTRADIRGIYDRMPSSHACGNKSVYKLQDGDKYLYRPDSDMNWLVSSERNMISCSKVASLQMTGRCDEPSDSRCDGTWAAATGSDAPGGYDECEGTWCPQPGLRVR